MFGVGVGGSCSIGDDPRRGPRWHPVGCRPSAGQRLRRSGRQWAGSFCLLSVDFMLLFHCFIVLFAYLIHTIAFVVFCCPWAGSCGGLPMGPHRPWRQRRPRRRPPARSPGQARRAAALRALIWFVCMYMYVYIYIYIYVLAYVSYTILCCHIVRLYTMLCNCAWCRGPHRDRARLAEGALRGGTCSQEGRARRRCLHMGI